MIEPNPRCPEPSTFNLQPCNPRNLFNPFNPSKKAHLLLNPQTMKPVAPKRWMLVASLALGLGVAWGSRAACGSNLWAALAEFESGGNDLAVGAVGEISRYQIRPEIWRRYAPPEANWRQHPDAL